MTNQIYEVLHFPAIILAYLFGFMSNPSEIGAVGDALPYTVIIQWLLVGFVISAIVYWRQCRREHAKDLA